jgi:hypothetical protein
MGQPNELIGEARETLHRNFWFSTVYDPLAFVHRHAIAVDRIMMESDYPHGDSTWPTCQDLIEKQVRSMPRAEIDRVTYLNACEVYRHPLPPTATDNWFLANGDSIVKGES